MEAKMLKEIENFKSILHKRSGQRISYNFPILDSGLAKAERIVEQARRLVGEFNEEELGEMVDDAINIYISDSSSIRVDSRAFAEDINYHLKEKIKGEVEKIALFIYQECEKANILSSKSQVKNLLRNR